MTITYILATALIGVLVAATTQAETVETPIGKLDFELGVPTQATVKNLYDQMDFQRACQLYIWALPLVEFGNLQAILEGTTGAKPGDLTIYTGNEQSVFLTPNATTPYIFAYLDLAKTGPVVMDIPVGGIAGSALDAWQRPRYDWSRPGQGRQICFCRAETGSTGGGGSLRLAVADVRHRLVLPDARPRPSGR